MKLAKLLPGIMLAQHLQGLDVRGISDDSREVRSGDLFFIMPGKTFDIFSVLGAVERFACAFVVDEQDAAQAGQIIRTKPLIITRNLRERFIQTTGTFYPRSHTLKVIGITGTNGKTTTAFCLYQLFMAMAKPVSLLGTVQWRIGSSCLRPTHTTPDFLTLQKLISKAGAEGDRFMIMEVSSHALDQNRIQGIDFSRCVFTNLTRDHLDYHKTMRSYFKAKQRFFLDNQKAVSIVNIDDSYGRKIYRGLKHKLSYGVAPEADYRISNVCLTGRGSRFCLQAGGRSYAVSVSLLGLHNVYNAVAALATADSLSLPLARAVALSAKLRAVDGRLNQVHRDIFVDYAHTPDALAKALSTLKSIGYKRAICVFGCGGDRDKGKRPAMGSIASRLADNTIITSDNPRSENPGDICRQIARGFSRRNFGIVEDRRSALRRAMQLLRKYYGGRRQGEDRSCCLLVAGKGHEDYQIIGNRRLAFKDSRVIKELAQELWK